MRHRRDFLATGLAVGGLAMMPAFVRAAGAAPQPPREPLKILVLGGTGFLGPHFVDAARGNGHRLTLFNRGRSDPARFSGEAFADIEQLRGDRKTDMSALEGDRTWDAVLDTSAYLPADVTRSAKLLAPRVGLYLIVSTVSVYARNDIANDEDSPLAQLPDPTVAEVTGETYGGLKALCERAAEREMPDRVSVVRPGLIVGPGDTTDRFTYWPARADRGGEILAPGGAGDPTQFIDVRDLAAFLLRLIEAGTVGTFNADAPAGALTMGALLDGCVAVAERTNAVRSPGRDATVTWVPAAFLAEQGVSPWQDMPVWLPAEGEYAGFGRTDTSRAQRAGLSFRPLEETIADTLAWWRTLPEARRASPKAGMAPAREAELLRAWHARAVTAGD